MRIAVFSHSLSRTGAPRVAIDVAGQLASKGDTVFLLYPSHRVKDGELNRIPEVPRSVRTVPIGGLDDYWSSSFLDPVRRRIGSDKTARARAFELGVEALDLDGIIFNTCFHADLQRSAQQMGLSTARYLHEGPSYLSRLRRSELTVMSAGPVFACSDSVAVAARGRGLHVEEAVIPASTDSLLAITREGSRSNELRSRKDLCALGVGTSHRKGFHWAQRLAETSDRTVCWIGDGSYGLRNLRVLPPKNFVPYEDAAVFLLLSEEEPWGLVALEAIAHGVPLVGWRTLDVIQAAEAAGVANGVEHGDIGGLCHAVDDVWGSAPSLKAVRAFLENYTTENTVEILARRVREHFGNQR